MSLDFLLLSFFCFFVLLSDCIPQQASSQPGRIQLFVGDKSHTDSSGNHDGICENFLKSRLYWTMSLPEEDLTCPICHEIFSDPVVLSCSHSFCRRCQERCWDARLRECPVCRKKTSKSSHFPNLALKNICEAVVQARREMEAAEERLMCPLHREKYKLFCLRDKEPICVVCQCSKAHKDHQCSPVEEATTDCKDKLNETLKSLQDKLDKLKTIHKSSVDMFKHIKDQSAETQDLIRGQFEELRQMLGREEAARLAAVKREEEEKMAATNDKMKQMAAEVLSLAESVGAVRRLLEEDDVDLLKKFKDHEDRNATLGSNNMCGVLIDVTNHLSNLKYRVWEKMLEHIDYTPVTLDPNTAHPCLILSDDLTSCHYKDQMNSCPDNPERFHLSAEVVGAGALGSGSHRWVVQTEGNRDWLLGVASSSIPRDAEVNARPENGFWTLCFRDGQVKAMTSPPTPLAVSRTPERIKVHVDYDKGAVMFWDADDDSLIHAYEHNFAETLLPYFYTQSSHPLRILPERVLVTMLRQ
ncbi:E3 ubiquitin-protein ligase TRIM35 isoform X2 [Phyllopteryx taeniolatus]|uniref:E3 ubiquitin-protein ligase TRIM35 isoform X2 n=1 Tax=Phyllopteryx taeniolatus TaxID=161469 RepID=UPI002AD4384D|nr:E3 ubiquitin-protein ligase TRIM35 isoform X2 [Phyllopteryx taeniolatus]